MSNIHVDIVSAEGNIYSGEATMVFAPAEIVAFAKEAMGPESGALFISCTAVRAAGVIAEIEAAIGKPVVSSNYATAWACLRLCGDTSARPELGRLMALPLEGEWP